LMKKQQNLVMSSNVITSSLTRGEHVQKLYADLVTPTWLEHNHQIYLIETVTQYMKFLTKDELATVCGSRELVRRIYKVALVTITLLDVNNRLSMDVVLEQLTKDSYSLLCFEKLEEISLLAWEALILPTRWRLFCSAVRNGLQAIP